MCLVLIGYHVHPAYPLVIAANRDEFFHRPARPAAFWEDFPSILAGRDLEKGGTWFGIDTSGRVAAVTNYREPPRITPISGSLSRGYLVRDYLAGAGSVREYLQVVARNLHRYDGFNLFAGDRQSLSFISSYLPQPRLLTPGIHGISNGDLDYPWPKVLKGKARLATLLDASDTIDEAGLFELLADRTVPEMPAAAASGLERSTERILAPIFVHSEDYGTRCSTLLLYSREGQVRFTEKSFDQAGKQTGTVTFALTLEENQGTDHVVPRIRTT
jgi:uncharacterized protein with NRDE domain